MMTRSNLLLIITATSTALIAGLFYAYSCSVNLGLGRLPDPAYIAAMQSINRAIQNPVFFMSFMGTVILLPLSTFLHYERPVSQRFKFLLAATIVYLIGVFGVTIFGNVPLNDALEAFNGNSASPEAIAGERLKFEGPWNQLNLVRTFSSLVALVVVILACLSPRKIA